MTKQEVELIIYIVTTVIKFGAPAVKNFIDYIEKDEITKEDIMDLIIDKDPEEFFS